MKKNTSRQNRWVQQVAKHFVLDAVGAGHDNQAVFLGRGAGGGTTVVYVSLLGLEYKHHWDIYIYTYAQAPRWMSWCLFTLSTCLWYTFPHAPRCSRVCLFLVRCPIARVCILRIYIIYTPIPWPFANRRRKEDSRPTLTRLDAVKQLFHAYINRWVPACLVLVAAGCGYGGGGGDSLGGGAVCFFVPPTLSSTFCMLSSSLWWYPVLISVGD